MIYKQQAAQIATDIHTLIHDCITIRETKSNASNPDLHQAIKDSIANLITALIGSEPTIKPVESCTCRAIDIPAADPTREIRPTSSTHWQTKDCAMLNTDKFYALWYCDSITQEILRVNGRVTWDGKLAELAGMDSASIDIGELYFWRVNLLKDELAAQSTSTAVEVEYSDNAEIETETATEYD